MRLHVKYCGGGNPGYGRVVPAAVHPPPPKWGVHTDKDTDIALLTHMMLQAVEGLEAGNDQTGKKSHRATSGD